MSNTTDENASSVHPDDLTDALHLVTSAAEGLRLAVRAAHDAHDADQDTDAGIDAAYLAIAEGGRRRDRALAKLEQATRVLARLAALRD